MKLQWRNCNEVEEEHRRNERQYAHTYHYADTICVCRAFWELPKSYRDGILLHEIGHLLVGPEGSEREATEAAEEFFDVPINYVDSPYGRELERLENMPRRRRRNPEEEIPFGEWVPAHAVMFNEDGTVSVMAEPGEALSNPVLYHGEDEERASEILKDAFYTGKYKGLRKRGPRSDDPRWLVGYDYEIEPVSNRGRRRRNQVMMSEARRERMLRELAGTLAQMVEDGDITDMEANDWYNMKADQWAHGLS